MSLTQFNLRQIIQRIKDTLKSNVFIGDSVDFMKANESKNFTLPSIYIVLENEVAQLGNDSILPLKGKKRQWLYARFNVITVTKNNRYQSESSESDLENILGRVRKSLIGWIPSIPTSKQCQLEGGQMIAYNSSEKVWQDNYLVCYAIGDDD